MSTTHPATRARYYSDELRDLHTQGEWHRIVIRCHELLGECRATDIESSMTAACVLDDLATAQAKLANYESAINTTRRMLRIDSAILGKISMDYGRGLSNLGCFYMRVGETRRAAKCFDRALQLIDGLPNDQRLQRAIVLVNMAHLCMDQQDFRAAERLLLAAAKQESHDFGWRHPRFGRIFFYLAKIYLQTGKPRSAAKAVRKAIRIYSVTGLENSTYKKMLELLRDAEKEAPC